MPNDVDTPSTTAANNTRRGLLLGGLAVAATACNRAADPVRRPAARRGTTTTSTTSTSTTTSTTSTTTPSTTTTSTTVPGPTTTLPGAPSAPPTTLTADHVARRLTYGPTPELLAEINTLGPAAWIESQLTMPASADAALDTQLRAAYPRTRNTALENEALGSVWEVVSELPAATTIRAVCARRQLFELTVAFLWDRFSVDIHHDRTQSSSGEYDTILRAGAFGRYADLLLAVARSGAMMNYLNQASSRADGGRVPIENFAREIMELHTVGVDGGYTDDDVVAVSYLLSGWTRQMVSWQWIGPYRFDGALHSLGPFTDPNRTVLGWSRGTLTGEAAGRSFIDHLAHHPATARRLAHHLAIRFIGDHVTANDAVVTAAAEAYLSADTSITALLRSLLTSNDFAASTRRRIRRPLELGAAMLRAVAGTSWGPADPTTAKWAMVGSLDGLNQVPHWWPDPNGYPDRDSAWVGVGSMIGRWNLATWISAGDVPGFPVDWTAIRNWTTGTTVGAWFSAACARLGVTVSTTTRDRMLSELYRNAGSPLTQSGNEWAMRRILQQLLQSVEFQTR
ncbi:MAG: DUF1800 domain-containing protein [Microthrixaceae bacterium]